MNTVQDHPTTDELTAFGLGKLNEAAAVPISEHLAACDPCMATLAGLDGDTYTDLIERADKVVLPVQAGDPVAKRQTLPTSTDVPPELAKHSRYRTIELIGRGGMGDVYKAEHRLMNRAVALKVMNQGLVANSNAVDRFRREVQAAAQLSHPNIVTSHDAEQVGDLHFLVMEYVDGTDLAQVVCERGPLPIQTACNWIAQAADGLQHAHDRGMVHRDIKPHNLMVAADGVIKILDFGLATFASSIEQGVSPTPSELENAAPDSPTDRQLTKAGAAMGTPDFISPEQSVCGQQADERSDIYSLGCTLYCLLTGAPPFPNGSVVEKLEAHRHHEPKAIDSVRQDVPAELSAVVSRMLAKDPDARFQSAGDVAQALDAWCSDPSSHSGAHHPTKKRLIALAGGGLVAACALFLLLPDDNSQPTQQPDNQTTKKPKASVTTYAVNEASAYQLQAGRVLQWIPPTRTSERPNGPHLNSSGQFYEQHDDTLRLRIHGLGEPNPLHFVVFSLLRTFNCDLTGDASVWMTEITGDFVVKKGATKDQIVRDLGLILKEEIKANASLSWHDEKTDVWVIDGTFQPAPTGDPWRRPEDKAYVLYGKSNTGNFSSNAGSFDDLLNAFGSRTGRPVISKLKKTPTGAFGWQTYYDEPERTVWNNFPRHFAKNIEVVAENFHKQTGLQITSVHQTVRLLKAVQK